MNNNFAILLAPMGCYTLSHGSYNFQRESQSYNPDPRLTTERSERRRLVRSVLSAQRLTPEVELIIRAHLRCFDLSDVWNKITEDRRVAAVRAVYDRVHVAACGRANGMAVFAPFDSVSAS